MDLLRLREFCLACGQSLTEFVEEVEQELGKQSPRAGPQGDVLLSERRALLTYEANPLIDQSAEARR